MTFFEKIVGIYVIPWELFPGCAEYVFPENHFNAYLSLGVIEHWEEGPQQAIAEASSGKRVGNGYV